MSPFQGEETGSTPVSRSFCKAKRARLVRLWRDGPLIVKPERKRTKFGTAGRQGEVEGFFIYFKIER